jgi:hypothetical protein
MLRHKHVVLDQRWLDRARRALGTKTDRDTIGRAIELAVREAEAEKAIIRALKRVKGGGGVEDVFGEP